MGALVPEDIGITDKKLTDKIVVISEKESWGDNFTPPTQYYIINAMGVHIYFRTNRRNVAQQMSDDIYGKGFFRVRRSMRATVC